MACKGRGVAHAMVTLGALVEPMQRASWSQCRAHVCARDAQKWLAVHKAEICSLWHYMQRRTAEYLDIRQCEIKGSEARGFLGEKRSYG